MHATINDDEHLQFHEGTDDTDSRMLRNYSCIWSGKRDGFWNL